MTEVSEQTTDDVEINGFAELGLRPEVLAALNTLGYEEPTPIQREAIPHIIEGRDLLGQAATGTGKTAAFALPLLQGIERNRRDGDPMALVLVPTRELAMQVSEAIHKYGRQLDARVLPIYGGQPIGRQLQALNSGVDVVVATPGRALDHINRGTLRLGDVRIVVLDEADEMLDMGFADELEGILAATPKHRQTLLFSATMPSRINSIAKRHLNKPINILIERPMAERGDAPQVRQSAYMIPRSAKAAALGRVLDLEQPAAALVFCRTRLEVDQLTETLKGRGYRAEALHGGMSQEQRDRVMTRLRKRTADLLIATDVAARGLDIEQLTHVINFDVPSAPESYVHRIGRVGRAGREGVAITLAEPREHRLLKNIERVTKQRIVMEKVPTVAELRNRRMDVTIATLRESLLEDKSEHFRVVVETLTDEFDLMEVALAAVKLAHEASGAPADEEEIPDMTPRESSSSGPGAGGGGNPWPRKESSYGDKRGRPEQRGPDGGQRSASGPKGRGATSGMARIFIGAGRIAGIRPQDLVGAIANESRLSGRDIGAIQIGDRFSLVEVPEASVDHVIAAMKGTTLKGTKATIRRDRDSA